jgi:nucleotide-binding universal stress UspA family protein
MKPILVAIDLGPASAKVAAAASELAATGAPVIPIHVLTNERLNDYRESLPAEGAFVDVLQNRLAGDVNDLLVGVPNVSEPLVVIGEPASVLISKAEEMDAAYIVIGIRNRSRVGKLLMGSDAQEILLNSPCPVVGVPV